MRDSKALPVGGNVSRATPLIRGPRFPSPGGRFENSPAVHCRVRIGHYASPEGTAESVCRFDGPLVSRPFGTGLHGPLHPALKRWAIITGPFGTNRRYSVSCAPARHWPVSRRTPP